MPSHYINVRQKADKPIEDGIVLPKRARARLFVWSQRSKLGSYTAVVYLYLLVSMSTPVFIFLTYVDHGMKYGNNWIFSINSRLLRWSWMVSCGKLV